MTSRGVKSKAKAKLGAEEEEEAEIVEIDAFSDGDAMQDREVVVRGVGARRNQLVRLVCCLFP